MKTPIPIGVRLPLVDAPALLKISKAACDLGYQSIWIADHVVLTSDADSPYPHTASGNQPFSSTIPWPDPFLTFSWMASQLSRPVDFGTAVLILPLRNPLLIAKQLLTLSWLTGQTLNVGVGVGWLRDDFELIGVPFKGRGRLAQRMITQIRELIKNGQQPYTIETDTGPANRTFLITPPAKGDVRFLWGGHSELALKIVAETCDGWLPTKRSFEELEKCIETLKFNCDAAKRDFNTLRMVAKPGPGPHPEHGAIDAKSIERYVKLGFKELVLELPPEPKSIDQCLIDLETVAKRASA